MNSYARVWRAVCLPVLAASAVAGLLVADTAALLAWIVTGAILGVLASFGHGLHVDWTPELEPGVTKSGANHFHLRHSVGRATRWAALAGAGAGATVAVAALLGTLTLPCVLAVAATSPPVAARLTRRMRAPSTLSNDELCTMWRCTTLALHAPTTPAAQLTLALRRQDYLDEMERRNPLGFQAWLETCLDSGIAADEALATFVLPPRRFPPRGPAG